MSASIDLTRIMYTSTASPELDWKGVIEITRLAKIHNRKVGLTGLLLMSDRMLFQVLEGPQEHLEPLLTKIIKDTRHQGINIFDTTSISERSFTAWSMKEVFTDRFPDNVKKHLYDNYPHQGDVLMIEPNPEQALALAKDIYRICITKPY